MCIEITYLYPHCGCISRIGRYTCYTASHISKTGFTISCERYKKTEQEMRTGPLACPEHLKLLELRPKVVQRMSEELTDVEEREGEKLLLDGVLMSGGVDGPSEKEERRGSEEVCEVLVDGEGERGIRRNGMAV
jgi:hypothetical protein